MSLDVLTNVMPVRQQPDWLARQLDVYARAQAAATSDTSDPAVNALAAEGDWFTSHAATIRQRIGVIRTGRAGQRHPKPLR